MARPKRQQQQQGMPFRDMVLLFFGPCMGAIAKFNHNWEWSCVMTLGQASMALAMAQVLLRLRSGDHVGPISIQAIYMTAVALAARLVPTSFLEGYTPIDETGSWLAQAFDAVALLCTLGVLRILRSQGRKEVPGGEWRWLAVVLMVPCLVFAVVCHSTLDANPFGDVAWAMATYTMALAPLPQLLRLQYSPPSDGAVVWAYLVPLLAAVMGTGSFWYMAYAELYVKNPKGEILSMTPGKAVFASVVVWFVLTLQCIGYNAWRTARTLSWPQRSSEGVRGGGPDV